MERMGERADGVAEPATAEPATIDFEAFFTAEHERLMRACFLLTGNAQEAEELMQDAFLAVWTRWDRVRSMDEPVGYLYRVAMNRHRSALRRAGRAARRVVGLVEGADAFRAVDEREAVARGLAELPRRQRQALVLTELLGFDASGAANLMGVKNVTVRSLASQGRAALRRALEEDEDD
jgi:RNA polymerase sigma factor (sigma-70 family)